MTVRHIKIQMTTEITLNNTELDMLYIILTDIRHINTNNDILSLYDKVYIARENMIQQRLLDDSN